MHVERSRDDSTPVAGALVNQGPLCPIRVPASPRRVAAIRYSPQGSPSRCQPARKMVQITEIQMT